MYHCPYGDNCPNLAEAATKEQKQDATGEENYYLAFMGESGVLVFKVSDLVRHLVEVHKQCFPKVFVDALHAGSSRIPLEEVLVHWYLPSTQSLKQDWRVIFIGYTAERSEGDIPLSDSDQFRLNVVKLAAEVERHK